MIMYEGGLYVLKANWKITLLSMSDIIIMQKITIYKISNSSNKYLIAPSSELDYLYDFIYQ
jgi:hypothetical protein